MKFECHVDINLPRGKVVELWNNPDNLHQWQEGFERIDHLNGIPGAVGSTAKLYFKNGKRDMVLLETVLINDLPDQFVGEYQHTHMINTMSNLFSVIDKDNTLYTAEIEYTRFIGIIPKLMAFFFPGIFRKQVQKWLDNFKSFAESQ